MNNYTVFHPNELVSASSDHPEEQRTSHTDHKEKVSLQKNHTFNTMRVFNMMYITMSPFRADSVLLPSDSSFTIGKQGQYKNIYHYILHK